MHIKLNKKFGSLVSVMKKLHENIEKNKNGTITFFLLIDTI